MVVANGSCLCGDVQLALALPSKWLAHCHCSLCRRAHGAAFVTWIGMQEGDVSITDPQCQLQWYASSPGAERGFCSRCGSTLFFRSTKWPGELHVARANIDGPLDREPQAHAYWDTHVAWVALDPADRLKRMPDPDASSA